MERTRLKDIKMLFFAGVNEGKIPKETQAGKLLSDINREGNAGSIKKRGTVPGAYGKGSAVYSEVLSVSEPDKAQ